jgi:aspartate racemase
MKTLGIIGGIAPPSTVDYYQRLTLGYRALSPEGSYPSLLINSIDATHFFPMVLANDRAALTDYLVAEVDRLARGGADVGLFASNTPHVVFDEVAARSPIPLISIVEETARVAQAEGFHRVGLLGLRPTVEGHFYPDVMARRGITVVIPDADDRTYVHDLYLGELVEGVFRDETRTGIAAVVDRMHARDQIDAIILGGTELSVLFREGTGLSVPTLDPTAIHVESAIAWLLGS